MPAHPKVCGLRVLLLPVRKRVLHPLDQLVGGDIPVLAGAALIQRLILPAGEAGLLDLAGADASGIPFSIRGMALIVVIWGFFEGFKYAVICGKINDRYPAKSWWLDYGAISCAIICLLFRPLSASFWGIVDIITTFTAIYGMLVVKRQTGNAWGCVFAFCFIWNAL